MSLIDPSTTTTPRRRSRSSAATTAGLGRSPGVRIVRAVLTLIWLVGVPVFAGVYVDQTFGAPWGLLHLGAGWPVLNIAALLATVTALALAVTLHRRRAITLLAVVPAVAAWIGYVGFGGGVHGWLGLVIGLVLGGITYAWYRPQDR